MPSPAGVEQVEGVGEEAECRLRPVAAGGRRWAWGGVEETEWGVERGLDRRRVQGMCAPLLKRSAACARTLHDNLTRGFNDILTRDFSVKCTHVGCTQTSAVGTVRVAQDHKAPAAWARVAQSMGRCTLPTATIGSARRACAGLVVSAEDLVAATAEDRGSAATLMRVAGLTMQGRPTRAKALAYHPCLSPMARADETPRKGGTICVALCKAAARGTLKGWAPEVPGKVECLTCRGTTTTECPSSALILACCLRVATAAPSPTLCKAVGLKALAGLQTALALAMLDQTMATNTTAARVQGTQNVEGEDPRMATCLRRTCQIIGLFTQIIGGKILSRMAVNTTEVMVAVVAVVEVVAVVAPTTEDRSSSLLASTSVVRPLCLAIPNHTVAAAIPGRVRSNLAASNSKDSSILEATAIAATAAAAEHTRRRKFSVTVDSTKRLVLTTDLFTPKGCAKKCSITTIASHSTNSTRTRRTNSFCTTNSSRTRGTNSHHQVAAGTMVTTNNSFNQHHSNTPSKTGSRTPNRIPSTAL